jgi:peptide-methionine (S)-S-oxide reductase
LQVDYDPNVISYRALLEVFWAQQNPTKPNSKRQYMNAVFTHDERQEELALETRAQVASGLLAPVTTHILPAGTFTLAEDYHQKFSLRGYQALMDAFFEIYPDFNDIVNSTAAARVNGYLAGHGTQERLEAEIASFGLPEKTERKLWEGLGTRYGWCPT